MYTWGLFLLQLIAAVKLLRDTASVPEDNLAGVEAGDGERRCGTSSSCSDVTLACFIARRHAPVSH